MNERILVVDDDPEIRSLLSRYLASQGFETAVAGCRQAFEDQFESINPDLIILDVMLPDGSGLDICQRLRLSDCVVPLILLTALKEDIDRIIGLEIGADDYLVKPFVPRELSARIRAVLRRSNARNSGLPSVKEYRFAQFVVEPKRRCLFHLDSGPIELTGAEFDLLSIFLSNPGRLLARDDLVKKMQGRTYVPSNRSVDVLVSRLRRKMLQATPELLFRAIRNGGYQLTVPVEIVYNQ